MDQGLKERLIGAAVLVALAVWLIPWLLDGPDKAAEAPETALRLPVPPRKAPQLKTEVIDLETPSAPPSPAVARASEPGGADAAQAPGGPAQAAPAAETASPAEARFTAPPAEAPSKARPAGALSKATPAAAHSTAPSASPKQDPGAAAALTSADAGASREGRAPSSPASSGRNTDTATHGDWAVQLGSFGDQENAQRLAERVAAYGAQAQISKYKADRRVMYRVRVGPYASRDKAEAAASSLGVHGFVAQVVTVH
ncbi:MAG TPA: SPOR domain-containing protein [Gammaproteobacteria bacterium]|nr:SPOR domain-containing protein [Gammaproteobacteria bacterium]